MIRSEDERVDGPKIAAQILKNMNLSNKEKIVKAIEAREPGLAKKINENLLNFDDILELTPQGVQTLIKEVEHGDLVLSFKLASADVQTLLLRNMSERKKAIVKSDFEDLGPVRKSDAEDAQRRILDKLDDLRVSGLIRTQSSNDMWI